MFVWVGTQEVVEYHHRTGRVIAGFASSQHVSCLFLVKDVFMSGQRFWKTDRPVTLSNYGDEQD